MLLALLSGILLALSFPKYGHPSVAWVALAPLAVALVRPQAAGIASRSRRAFSLGLVTGAVYFAGTLYWLVETMTTFGGLSTPLAVLAASILVAYLSLFPALFAMIVSRLVRPLGTTCALMLAPAVWVATELGRQYLWDGFPWELLGYSQVTVLPIAQLASVLGVYGLSWLLAFSSCAIVAAIAGRGRARWIPLGLTVVLVSGIAAWGATA